MNYTLLAMLEFQSTAKNIVNVMIAIIVVGIIFRSIVIIQKAREQEQSWSQTWVQLKNLVLIGVISALIYSLINIIDNYFK